MSYFFLPKRKYSKSVELSSSPSLNPPPPFGRGRIEGSGKLVFQHSHSNFSFTLLEVMIALFVISLGAIGAFSLISQTFTFPIASSQRLIAAYLGQEGLEIVRNIRDSNWLEGYQKSWNDGLDFGYWEADYNDTRLTTSTDRALRFDGGFYNYDSGREVTQFKRKIIISPLDANALRVSVQVEWQERGRINQIVVQENLYNWVEVWETKN